MFITSISNFTGLDEKLARITGYAYMAEGARVATARMVDQGLKPLIPSAILKYHLTENMRQAVTDAMDILGGKGVMSGPSNPINRAYTAIPIAITVEGANDLTRNMIIFGQGGVRAHKHVGKILKALTEKDNVTFGLEATKLALDTTLKTLKGYTPKFMHGGGIGDVDPQSRHHYKRISKMSAKFNVLANITYMHMQGKLKFEERSSARLGDVMSNLYLASCALQKFENDGRPEEDRDVLNWVCQHCFYEADKAMNEFLDNYPNKAVAAAIRAATKPMSLSIMGMDIVGMPAKPPSDQLDSKLARDIVTPGSFRDRLTDGIYKPTDPADHLSSFERAFNAKVESADLERKIKKGEIDVTAEIQAQLDAAQDLYDQMMAVDEFELDMKTVSIPATAPGANKMTP